MLKNRSVTYVLGLLLPMSLIYTRGRHSEQGGTLSVCLGKDAILNKVELSPFDSVRMPF